MRRRRNPLFGRHGRWQNGTDQLLVRAFENRRDAADIPARLDVASADELEDIGDRFASIRSRLLELDATAASCVDNIPGGVDGNAHRCRRKTQGLRAQGRNAGYSDIL